MTQNKDIFSLATLTFAYSLLLATITQAAHTLTRVALSLAIASGATSVLNPGTLFGELAMKIGWSAFSCEAVVLLSVFARRRWLALIAAATVSVFVGAVLGQYLRVQIETAFGNATAFLWQAALDSGTLLSSRYIFVGAALAWANRAAESGLRHYLGAGIVAAVCASFVTLLAMNAEPVAKLGTLAVDVVFPIGCSALVWKVRQMAEPLIMVHRETKAILKNI